MITPGYLDLLAAKASEKQIELAYLAESGIPNRLVGDVTRLRQILVNLVGNAIKFTDEGEVFIKLYTSPFTPDLSSKTALFPLVIACEQCT